MKSKHTPGPWKVERHGMNFQDCDTDTEIWNQNTHIATINEAHGQHEVDDQANARLIAAAPEMLDALIMIQQAYKRPGSLELYREAVGVALKVLAKLETK
jgi:hypothetical protein